MEYLIIADWDENNLITRCNRVSSVEEAEALVSKLRNNMPSGKEAPNAFHVPFPKVKTDYIRVNADKKSITIDTDMMARNKVQKLALAEIQRLESSVTPRRIREMLTDAGKQWVNNVEELIAIERGKL